MLFSSNKFSKAINNTLKLSHKTFTVRKLKSSDQGVEFKFNDTKVGVTCGVKKK